jgi:SAM-dependent methyltransferase
MLSRVMDVENSWDLRTKEHGHTGWKDPLIYAYDQPLRLRTVAHILNSHVTGPRRKALDYGCGRGDFSLVLRRFFASVVGIDISPAVLAEAGRGAAGGEARFIPLQAFQWGESEFDLILSVTVLQHILNDKDLEDTLDRFVHTLAPGGHLLCLESLGADYAKSTVQGDIVLRPRAEFIQTVQSAGFELQLESGFYHPTLAPILEYKIYQFAAKTVRKLGKWISGREPSPRTYRKLVRWLSHRSSGLTSRPSLTRILLFKKAGAS